MSSTARNQVFSGVQTIGSLLPADMLVGISESKEVSGSTPADYGVVGAFSVRDEAERHWNYLKGAWQALREKLPQDPAASPAAAAATAPDPTGLALSHWLEPLFAELGFGRLQPLGAAGLRSDDGTKTFPISHRWTHVPINLVPWDADLDRRLTGVQGAAPPQSLVQELLNRSEAHLWALLSNGRQLRLLHDSASLVGASYVEFDLEAIFDGELFSEFVLLYRLLHVSRFEVAADARPETCRLEQWRNEAIDSGTRALEQLRDGVRKAVESLGTGFTQHPTNTKLRDEIDADQLKKALLRLVYRLLFVFVAEDRDILIPQDAAPAARERYERYFSTARLRETARRKQGTTHGDRWDALHRILDHLRTEGGFAPLGLPGLGGIFELNETDAVLDGTQLSNEALLKAVRALSIVYDVKAKRNRVVDYRHLGSEELGSIYESLLEYVPKYDPADRTFDLVELAGNERKTTGSYYTPTTLIDCLLDSALDPVLDQVEREAGHAALKSGKTLETTIQQMLLAVKVCDPACGSGHFLVAAARRIAKRVAAVREGNPEPTIDAVRVAMRDVVANCIYGVDLNPMAVELAKVSLWLEALEPGKPLGFLDAHIKQGNALLGATPKLLLDGIPDDAFKPIEGDDKSIATALRKRNAEERAGQGTLFVAPDIRVSNVEFARQVQQITGMKADELAAVHQQEAVFRAWEQSDEYEQRKHVANAWCAAFVWPKVRPKSGEKPLAAVTQAVLEALDDPESAGVAPETHAEIERLANEYQFFHWHLEFPEVFRVADGDRNEDVDERTGWSHGFNCVLGNPPWERIKLQEQEFFAQRDAAIATAPNAAARKKLIAALPQEHPELAEEFSAAKRISEGERHFLRNSQRYPLTGRGDVNTYAVFAELDRGLISSRGRTGLVLPIGIGTDATTAPFFADLVKRRQLVSFLGFENESFILSRAVHHSVNFCLLVMAGHAEDVPEAYFSSKVRNMDELATRQFAMPPEDILLLNPNTGTSPMFRTQRDADITLGIYQRVPILINESADHGNAWHVSLERMFHMSDDSGLFHTREQLDSDGWTLEGNVFVRGDARMLPLYEAKMIHHFDHRLGTYEGQTEAQANMGTLPRLTEAQHDDPSFAVLARYWVAEGEVGKQVRDKNWDHGWLLGWRDICRATDERTMITAIVPAGAISEKFKLALARSRADLLNAVWSSFALDYVARQKIGATTMSYFYVRQLPVLPPETLEPHADFINPRVLELTYSAYDMEPFARDLGDSGAPFRWGEERRFLLRAELDALFFRLYGIRRDDVDYIMETFPIVKRKDIAAHGCYRTKDQILAVYDAMAAADASGVAYRTILDPAPGFGPRHPQRPDSPQSATSDGRTADQFTESGIEG